MENARLIFPAGEYNYARLHEQTAAYRERLKEQAVPGTVVALVSDYTFEAIALFFALHELKAIVVPITTRVEEEIEGRLQTARCEVRIDIEEGELAMQSLTPSAERFELVEQLKERGHSGLILFSSGSTGAPKAMIHDLDHLVDSYKGKRGKKLVFLIFLMFDHIGGLNTLLNCLAMGVTMVYPADRNPEHVAQLIERHRVNVLPASPTFLNLMLISGVAERYDLSSLRMITYGTEPMPDSLLVKLKEGFPRVKFLQTFGTSETGIAQTTSKANFIKIDDPGTEYKVVDGELWLRSKTQIMGYLNASMERFTDDGWFRTGDLGEMGEDGYIRIIGRNKEMINVGGEKVLPSEVESVLYQMPGVLDCTVYAEKNHITGQMVAAKMLFNEPLTAMEAKRRVVDFCKTRLARYKIPAKVVVLKEGEHSEGVKKKRIADGPAL